MKHVDQILSKIIQRLEKQEKNQRNQVAADKALTEIREMLADSNGGSHD